MHIEEVELQKLFMIAKVEWDPSRISYLTNAFYSTSDSLRSPTRSLALTGTNTEFNLLELYSDFIKATDPIDVEHFLASTFKTLGVTFASAQESKVTFEEDMWFAKLKFWEPYKDLTSAIMKFGLQISHSDAVKILGLNLSTLRSIPHDNKLSFKYLEDAINSGSLTLPMVGLSLVLAQTQGLGMSESVNPKEVLSSNETELRMYFVTYLTLYMTLAIEMEHQFKKLDEDTRKILNASFKHSGGEGLTRLLYVNDKGLLRPEIQAIIAVDDDDTRLRLNYEYVDAASKEIVTMAHTMAKGILGVDGITKYATPQGLSIMLEMVWYHTLYHIRTNEIRVLYEFLKNNDALPKGSMVTDESDMPIPDEGGMLGYDGETADSMMPEPHLSPTAITEIESDDDMDSKRRKSDTHVSKMLDGMVSSMKLDKYTFDIKDVISTGYDASYASTAEAVNRINQNLIRRIREIKVYNEGGKNPGKSRGKIDRKTIHRYKTDPRIFYDTTYKVKESDLAFGIILDESGSMHGRGISDGRLSMIVLHETLKALGINHSIIGHTSSGRLHVDITRYQNFKEQKGYTNTKNYAMTRIKAKSGNCDSGALYYMERALDRVKNKDKFCLIFSDGAPTECTETELRQQVANMEKKGITVIGIGIGFDNIKKYYKKHANGKNLTEMLDIITDILQDYVLNSKG